MDISPNKSTDDILNSFVGMTIKQWAPTQDGIVMWMNDGRGLIFFAPYAENFCIGETVERLQ